MPRAALVYAVLAFATGSGAVRASDLPSVGRSLFDHWTSWRIDGRSVQRIPYPFQSLLAELEARSGTDALGRPGVAAVLIPLGRSLQRNASPGDYFRHPRIVAAVTGENPAGAAAPLARDRLFLGFQDETGIIEVISYNERAGRFEFQVVTDYRAGATPKVAYARRAVCTSCHHGGGPIFSRPSWDETNANPSVALALAEHATSFHGVPVARGVDVPNAIDDAVARANRIALVQTLWRSGCKAVIAPSDPVSCRAGALFAALELRLGAIRGAPPGSLAPAQPALQAFTAAWQGRWPAGLPEPDPNIPNRDPFFGEAQRLGAERMRMPYAADEISPALDPMARRAPIAVWRADALGLERFLRSLGEMFAASDIAQLAHQLEAGRALRRPHETRPGQAGARSMGEAAAEALHGALAALADATRAGRSRVFADVAFQRVATMKALLAQLGRTDAAVCCDLDDDALPAARMEQELVDARFTPPAALQPFYEHCAVCHAAPAESPPGFLSGSAERVAQSLRRCAPRIRYRLSMWQVPRQARAKMPMPPPVFVPAWNHAPPREDLARMLAFVDAQMDAASRERLLTLKYETLPACRESSRLP